MTVDDFIRTFKDIEVDIKDDRSRGLIEIDLPKTNYMFYLFSYEQISHMDGETAFYIAYALHKTLVLLESETCKKWIMENRGSFLRGGRLEAQEAVKRYEQDLL